jgi:NAD(P)-dependent dehydrogenase (short-subunit alcohol dehydrogenase family)
MVTGDHSGVGSHSVGGHEMEQRHVGRVALVTGAGSGIGRATAQRLAAEGAAVGCLDIDGATAEATAKGIADSGGRAVAVIADVSAYGEVVAAVERTTDAIGTPGIVCNIAGIGWFSHSHEEDPDRFARVIAVNLTGTFNVCRAVLPGMVERADGVIVNTASNAGLQGLPWSAGYCASKGGVVQLTRALATEYLGRGVRINAVAPGSTNTNIIAGFIPPEGADLSRLAKIVSPEKMAEPEEMASVFAFVASDEARFMTGSIVSMDGGLTC